MTPEEKRVEDAERMAYAERKADELMTSRLEDMKILSEQAQITMTVTIAAMSAVFGFAIQLFRPLSVYGLRNQDWEMLSPTLVLAAFLVRTAYDLLDECMTLQPFSPPGQTPDVIVGEKALHPDEFMRFRLAELLAINRRIHKNRIRNDKTAAGLNKARRRLILAPGVFVAAFILRAVLASLA